MNLQHASFVKRDVAEIAIGAVIMAFPVSTTEEIWRLGVELSDLRIFLLGLASLLFLALTVLLMHHDGDIRKNPRVFRHRVLSTYGLTLVISALLLCGIDRLDLFVEPLVALKRTILVAIPACFAATTVDSFRS